MREINPIKKRFETRTLSRQFGWRLDRSGEVHMFCYEVVYLHKHGVCMNNDARLSPKKSSHFWGSLMFPLNWSVKFQMNPNNSCLKNSSKCCPNWFWTSVCRKARNFIEFRWQVFAKFWHNTVGKLTIWCLRQYIQLYKKDKFFVCNFWGLHALRISSKWDGTLYQ